jgi:hypothetical protein
MKERASPIGRADRCDGEIGSGTDNHALNLGLRMSFRRAARAAG